jgi:AcrR family transcriptional regulator
MTKATGVRERAREELTRAIKDEARRQLGEHGAQGLSLRAVARELGMASSALYRYYPSRDDLLTALIIDAYNALGETVERADAGQPREDLPARWLAVAHAVRDWALAQPHEYALIYGSPVPGYQAPQDTVVPATRSTFVLGGILRDGVELGILSEPAGEPLPEVVHRDLAALRELAFPTVPERLLAYGMGAWVLIFGMVSFELFGQFNTVLTDRRAFFDQQMRIAYAQLASRA